ncbi:MAG: hypothetical protein K0Q53_75 [Massilibacillus sp.]|nr:hypothetical protein [Massilibacillus sp.]
MINIPIKAYDPIIEILRNHLLSNSELASFVTYTDSDGNPDQAIYPSYMDEVENPVYPSITICMDNGKTLKNRTGYEEKWYYIHGWSKNSPDEVAYLKNLVIDILDYDPIRGNKVPEFAMIRNVSPTKCPLYDGTVRTHYMITSWLIHAKKSLINT